MKKFAKITAFVLVAVLLCTALAACGGGKSPEDVKAALEKDGWEVELSTDAAFAGAKLLDAEKGEAEGGAFYQEDKDLRKAQKTLIEEFAKAFGEDAKVHEKGNWVYFGDDDFIKAFKKAI